MLNPNEFICPLCGEICPTLADYHKHYAKVHRKKEVES